MTCGRKFVCHWLSWALSTSLTLAASDVAAAVPGLGSASPDSSPPPSLTGPFDGGVSSDAGVADTTAAPPPPPVPPLAPSGPPPPDLRPPPAAIEPKDGKKKGNKKGPEAALDEDPPDRDVVGKQPKVAIHGYLQIQGTHRQDTNGNGSSDPDTLFIRRARLAAKGRIIAGIKFEVEGDFAEPMSILKDAHVTVELIPHHRIRIGQQKLPFGYENRLSASRLLVIRRSEATDELGRGDDARDIGIQVLGDWTLPAGLGLSYAAAVVNGAGANVIEDDTPRKNVLGRVGVDWASPARKVLLDLGGSFANGDRLPIPGGAGLPYTFERYGGDFHLEAPLVFAAVEYIAGVDHFATGDIRAHGYYVFVAGRTPWNLGPMFRYQWFDPDRDLPGLHISRYMGGAYYDLVPVRARLLLNYEIDRSLERRDDALYLMAQVVF